MVRKLFCSTAKVTLPSSTRPLLVLPVILTTPRGITFLTFRPAHFTHMHQRLLPLFQR
ncbi:Uncharacterised protein [Vibrio cholerae]|nr:Uncharacterised protein [Vibrio cholerae]